MLKNGEKFQSLRNYMQKYRGYIEPSSGVQADLTNKEGSSFNQLDATSPDFSQILDQSTILNNDARRLEATFKPS